ncbi:helix-turn-helix domain protein [Caldalkalibacillus thermarum TA2.A1]|uniref:Helix-turn-helix domain protein n=1 Tax=Caldalkalibacillus thermarum (strain TA2.A1) TaxID=986075 RepID=F5L4R0_CALTT|nr:helix-turn-helix transcriptional regulator [Caldalkalibacillus thermarum]EGL83659.1 helix-turn-helix domain protein [Caldalkalibacillus thermarum TA2.A1]QZT34709.1 helix-turn-helix domain-containing protein [Caldalkalibacillus thermarum TA2.A1]
MTKLEFLRRSRGLSQVELAERLGVHPTIIVHIERGYRKPYPKIREALADFFGISEARLFHEDGWPQKVDFENVV